MTAFSDSAKVASYAEKTAMLVPGLRDIHKMTTLLLAERAPADARILVLGAGGGMELKAFAEAQPDWRFDGVDPSAEMLALARTSLGSLASRAHFHEGYIESAPEGPFDAATCLLTLHFLPQAERSKTLNEVYRRLRSGAPFVVAHHSFPNEGTDKARWLSRNAAFGVASGLPAMQAKSSIAAISERLPVLSPEQDVALLREAGFENVELFYAGFTFKGWVAYKP